MDKSLTKEEVIEVMKIIFGDRRHGPSVVGERWPQSVPRYLRQYTLQQTSKLTD